MLTLKDIFEIASVSYSESYKYLNTKVSHFWIYTETLKKDSIYFHWKSGGKNDVLIDIALKKGAFVFTSDKRIILENKNPKIIYVTSVRRTIESIAKYKRNNFEGDVISITGSVGKSSVKNMLSSLLGMNAKTLCTLCNENTWLGTGAILCNIDAKTKYIV